MKKEKKYIEYILKQAEALLAIDSPSGFTEKVTDYLCEEYKRLGYKPVKTKKGGVLVEIGGKGNAILTMAHVDTLGGMVAEIKSNGRLRLTRVGGLNANNIETENCRIYTLDGKVYDGTVQLTDASIHVNDDYQKSERTFDSVEVLLDEKVSSKEDVKALGIENGSFVCMDPRTRITESGYIKSRFLDDKLSTAILLGFAKYVKDEDLKLSRKVYQHITVFEEVGHGACASAPEDVEELLSVDMGCVGEGLECTDRQVSICVKDGHGPYHYDVVKALIQAAKDNHIDYAADVYPYYEDRRQVYQGGKGNSFPVPAGDLSPLQPHADGGTSSPGASNRYGYGRCFAGSISGIRGEKAFGACSEGPKRCDAQYPQFQICE